MAPAISPYNNSGMSQFYFRFIRYTSTEAKDIYFLTYAGSIESNLMQMVLAKEKLNLFMKGQDVNLDEIYEKFNVDYDLLSLLMRQEKDEFLGCAKDKEVFVSYFLLGAHKKTNSN